MQKKIFYSIVIILIIFGTYGCYSSQTSIDGKSWWIFSFLKNKCGDTICDAKEQANPDLCPKDCVSFEGTKIYYVSKQGNDNNDGSEARPWLTIQKAVNSVTAGDTVYVKKGTYEEEIIITISGTADKRIIFSKYKNDKVNLKISGCNGFYLQGDYITLRGFNITGPSPIPKFDYPPGRCVDWIRAGIQTHFSYNIFENNEISNIDYGIILRNRAAEEETGELFPPSDGYNIIRNNYIHGTIGSGIRVKRTSYNIIDNNTISDNPLGFGGFCRNSAGKILWKTGDFDNCVSVLLYGEAPITFYCLKGLTITNNIIKNPSYGPLITELDAATRPTKHPNSPPSMAPNEELTGCPLTTDNLVIKNNIGYKTENVDNNLITISLGRGTALGSGNVINYNIWYNGNPGSKMIEFGYNWWHDNDKDDGVAGKTYTLTEFQKNTGYDRNSRDTNPFS